ncbi:hypothetical protein ACFLXT_02730 [Chloroflexota bacterium]
MVTELKAKQHYGDTAEAYAADPSRPEIYEFRYKVVELGDLVTSHNSLMQPNPDYPQELQPRLRDRAASKTQVDSIARNLNARALLHDTGFIDTGPMIVGSDNVVESGNGRTLGLIAAASDYPQRYRLYQTMLANQAGKYGLNESDIEGMKQPVLVRERVTDVDRVEFARAANVGAVMGMSPYEQAINDAKKLKPAVVSQLQVGEDQTIDQAIRLKANDHIVKHFVNNIPENERATIADAKGQVNIQGLNRLKLALFTRTYTGEAGQRLARIFGESADPQIKSIENAMFQTLPDMAKAESLIDVGDRDKDLSISPDLGEVIDTYAGIKTSGITVKDYLKQQALFEDRLTPLQKDLLNHMDDIARKPKMMREFMRDVAQKIIDAPATGQTTMLDFEPFTKGGMVYAIINRQRTESGQPPITTTATTAAGEGLAKPDTGGIKGTRELAAAVGTRDLPDTGSRQELAPSTSVQVGLAGLGKETAQVKAFEEFGTAPGAGGKKDTLVDVEAIKAAEADKPLPGQIDFITGKTVEGKEIKGEGVDKAYEAALNKANKASRIFRVAQLAYRAGEIGDEEFLRAKTVHDKADREFGVAFTTAQKVTPKVKTKAKAPKTKKDKAVKYTKGQLLGIEQKRSAIAKGLDESMSHNVTIKYNSPKVGRWINNPGTADIQGIDTPKGRISKRIGGISDRAGRISKRASRISPKTPRLR